MKRNFTLALQTILTLIGIAVLFLLLYFPTQEGRAENLDLFEIYSDPLILYGYFVSIAFFIGLYKTIQLLGYAGNDELHSSKSVNTLKTIRICAVTFAVLVAIAALFIRFNHSPEDDPAGFIAMSIIISFICAIIYTVAGKIMRSIAKSLNFKS